MLTPLRRFRGLRWKKATPSLAELGLHAQNILLLLVLLLAYGLVGAIDHATEQSLAAEEATGSAEMYQQALIACMNGGAPGFYTTDEQGMRHYIVCADTYTISDENITGKRS